ncbi:hypothetical protein RchiOBHm_Chr6g0254881 [Rosa chinensis]|uniref:Uncharacterized protein n=1 Tax=Rosa chinensis TaxID=74649 RepID=A0A2P6PLP7_ROSCH|nr:hypothetical protein RchiOBHm_Chr6g0254881 [Rosa chinensis]
MVIYPTALDLIQLATTALIITSSSSVGGGSGSLASNTFWATLDEAIGDGTIKGLATRSFRSILNLFFFIVGGP